MEIVSELIEDGDKVTLVSKLVIVDPANGDTTLVLASEINPTGPLRFEPGMNAPKSLTERFHACKTQAEKQHAQSFQYALEFVASHGISKYREVASLPPQHQRMALAALKT